MKAKFRRAGFATELVLLLFGVAVPGITAARAESVQPRPVVFHLHRGPLSASFLLANDAGVRIGTNANASLMDLRVGQVALIGYTIENGRWLAHQIVVKPPHGKRLSAHSSEPNELHAHGAILGYDSSTGRLTIRFHR
jgi:hypothetical protein